MKLTRRDFLLFGVLLYFTFIGGTFYSQFNFTLRLANQIIVTTILGGWLLYQWLKKEGLPATTLDGAVAAYLGVSFVSAWLGLSPRFSLETWWFTLTHTLAFYLLVDLMRRGWTAKLTWAFFMTSAVVCLVGLAEFLAWYVGAPLFPAFAQGWVELGGWRQPIPPMIYRLAITLNGSTPLSAYLALLIPPAIGLIFSLPRRNENRQALWVWLILAFIIQILTFSRAGVLALATSTGMMIAGWYALAGKRLSAWQSLGNNLRGRSRLVLMVSLLAVLGLAVFWLQNSFANRAGNTQFRFVLWQVALQIFQDHPLSGAGPGNFGRALLRYNQANLPRLQMSSAHNVYLNTAAELGLLGVMAGGYLIWQVGRAWWRRWQRAVSSPPVERVALLTCGAALLGLIAQTLVDTYSATPNILLMLALVAYIVSDVPVEPILFRQRLIALGTAVLLLVYMAGFAWITRADGRFQKSLQAEAAGNWVEAISEAQEANRLDPYLPLYTYRLAFAEARLAALTQDPQLISAAAAHYQAGLQQEPIWGLNSANLAGMLWQQGQRAEAIDILQRTITAEEEPLYVVNLGYFYEQEGDWAKAGAAYGQALTLAPILAGSGFWAASPERAARNQLFIEQALTHLNASAKQPVEQLFLVQVALAQGDFDRVEKLAGSVSATTDLQLRTALAEVYLRRNEPEQVEILLASSAIDSSQDYFLRGRQKLLSGDQSLAEKYLKTAVFLGERRAHTYLGQLYEQQGDLRAAESAYLSGFLPHYISENIETTIYGRPGSNDLVPQLLRIGVGPMQAESWLALARLYEQQERWEEAKRVYELLLIEDPFLKPAQERLMTLTAKVSN
ncbi:MAG: O-antigen ligase family protein [Anaerolineae bacterium]